MMFYKSTGVHLLGRIPWLRILHAASGPTMMIWFIPTHSATKMIEYVVHHRAYKESGRSLHTFLMDKGYPTTARILFIILPGMQ
jgi:hypothetical protein